MNKFFVSDEVYNDRIAICKECVYYFKPTGSCKVCLCFMSIKGRLAHQECPKKFWIKTTDLLPPDEVPEHLIEEVLLIWKDIKRGIAKDIATKKRMVELFNTIYGANNDTNTNCGSCLVDCFKGIKRIYEKYKI